MIDMTKDLLFCWAAGTARPQLYYNSGGTKTQQAAQAGQKADTMEREESAVKEEYVFSGGRKNLAQT